MGAFPHDSPAEPARGRLGADLAAHVEAIVHAAEREARAAEQAIAEHRRSAEEEVRRYLAAARLQVDAETAARAARIETLSTAARRLAAELTDAVAALTRELHADDRAAADRLPRPPWPPTAAPTPEPPEHAAPASAAPIVATPEPHAAPESAAPTVPTPEPTWSRIEGEGAAAPSPAAAQADAAQTAGDTAAPADAAQTAGGTAAPADADRAGGAAEDDFATPLAKSPRAATGPARHAAEPEHAGAPNGQTDGVPSAARLVAIEMAVGGSSRAEVEQHLRDRLGVAEPEPLLDDVFGVASDAGSRLAWGEP
ncbi:MAG TPA: hypothetical protein VN635_06790 [Conexibacter sp.]|nr:hypothetical protein [Conexibacter sp.]